MKTNTFELHETWSCWPQKHDHVDHRKTNDLTST